MKRTHALAAVAILLSAQLSSAVTFFNLLGHRADNCASELWNFRYNSGTAAVPARNCIQAGRVNQEPASSNVVLLPLQFTRGPLVPATLTVTVTGNGFDRLNGQASVCLGLPTNDPSRYCTGGQLGFGCDTTLSIQTLTASNAFPTSFPQAATFTIPLGGNPGDWNQNFMEFDPAPRPLCWNPAGPALARGPYTETTGDEFPNPAFTTVAGVQTISSPFIWTGFTVGVAWNCSDSANPCTNRLPANSVAPANQLQQAYVSSLTQCCPGNPQAEFAGGAMSVCINPNVQQCCGNTQFNLGVEKCCNQGQSTTAFINGACRCSNIGGNNDCSNGAENTCCLQTKFPVTNNAVLNQTGTTVDVFGFQWGQCYDPTSEQCCNTGYRFDPATHVCCPINGLQSADQPCPCQADTDCAGVGAGNQRCCLQEAPALTGATCNIFANFPSGQAPSENQRCNGVCINRAWQVCCNGVPCVRNYEKCCNDTCCNKFTGSCLFARRGAAAGFSSNNVEVTQWYEQCSTVEHLDTVKSYLLFALPATLLLSSLSVLALALVFANKSSARVFSLLERVLIACAVLSIFLVFPVFFSHLYKYAEVVVFASIVAIFTASVRVRWLNIFSIVVLAITVIYIFDPFYGNAFLTLAYQRQYNSTQLFSNPRDDPHFFIHGTQDPATSGLFHSTAQLFFNSRQTLEVQACTTFYDYFILDQDLLDIGRIDNPEIVTFGYCSRAYVIALLYFEAFVGLFVLLQFVLAMLALIVRFRKTRFDPIELEVRQILLDE